MTHKEAIGVIGSEIFTLNMFRNDKEMEIHHGERFKRMIEALQIALKALNNLSQEKKEKKEKE